MTVSDRDKRQMLQWVRQVITGALGEEIPPKPDFSSYPPCGAFVTIHKAGQLRGCIGYTIAEDPLETTLEDAARSAAFRDPRFPPLGQEELELIDLEISLLTPPEEIDSPDELEMGVHGALIRAGFHSGLFLPQVATEQGWEREEFMDHLCLKAGLPRNHWRKGEYRLFRFSAIIISEKKDL